MSKQQCSKSPTSLMQTRHVPKNQASHLQMSVRHSASFKLIQILQQQVEELLHPHESLNADSVNKFLPTLELLQGPRRQRLRPLLLAVPLPPLVQVSRQGGDLCLDLRDPGQCVGDQAVVAIQDRHDG